MVGDDWRPSATIERLRQRAELLQRIRSFFAQRGVMEVDTPALASATTVDPAIASVKVHLNCRPNTTFYLQTSPEFAMKRLLAAGSGPIYQLGKVFRDDELGRLHQAEFTLLEWYRPGFDDERLIDEVGELMTLLGAPPIGRITYREAFERYAGVDPLLADDEEFRMALRSHGVVLAPSLANASRDVLLDLLMSHVVGPQLGIAGPQALKDYPASQAAYAKIKLGTPAVAARFEVFGGGIELANGYYELTDPAEQRRRFEQQNGARRGAGQPEMALDYRLLAALDSGVPECAGVAFGVDRLAMWLAGEKHLSAVIPFDLDRA